MSRKEPTQSVRIRESDYEILLLIMHREGLKTITEAISFAIKLAAAASK